LQFCWDVNFNMSKPGTLNSCSVHSSRSYTWMSCCCCCCCFNLSVRQSFFISNSSHINTTLPIIHRTRMTLAVFITSLHCSLPCGTRSQSVSSYSVSERLSRIIISIFSSPQMVFSSQLLSIRIS
jgi:hypothetical protein